MLKCECQTPSQSARRMYLIFCSGISLVSYLLGPGRATRNGGILILFDWRCTSGALDRRVQPCRRAWKSTCEEDDGWVEGEGRANTREGGKTRKVTCEEDVGRGTRGKATCHQDEEREGIRRKVTHEVEFDDAPTAVPSSGLASCEFKPRQAHRGFVSGETGRYPFCIYIYKIYSCTKI